LELEDDNLRQLSQVLLVFRTTRRSIDESFLKMTAIPLQGETLLALKDKVVVITGSAHGIGLQTVILLHSSGAKVIHGDWDSINGQKVDTSLTSPSPKGGETTFVKTDVTDYDSIINLFEVAREKYGRVDVAISNAGITELENWFDPSLSLESIKIKPHMKVLDVNLTGCLYFSRIASVYLKLATKPSEDKSLVLVSSTAGFKETPGLFTYTAAKHGIIGLLRSSRPYLPKTHNIRINAICPWMTDTVMAKGIREMWIKEGMPVNTPEQVARVMLEVAVGKVSGGKGMQGVEGERWNGRAVFVEGGRAWDIEEGINGTEEVWLSEKVAKTLNRGQVILGDGSGWAKDV